MFLSLRQGLTEISQRDQSKQSGSLPNAVKTGRAGGADRSHVGSYANVVNGVPVLVHKSPKKS